MISLKEFTKNCSFWVKGRQIIPLDEIKHIDYVLQNPNLFPISKMEIETIYKKYNEPIGFEGRARDEIIKIVAKDGWIRIRHYMKHLDYWSIQCDIYRKRKEAILNFIDYAIDKNYMNYRDAVTILSYNTDEVISYSFRDGGISKLFEKNKKIIKILDRHILIETSLSRLYAHSKNGFFLISAFRGEYTEKENLRRTKELESDLRGYGLGPINLGYIEVYGKWIENKNTPRERVSYEISLFVPYRKEVMSPVKFYALAVDLMVKYDQEAIFYKEPGDSVFYLLDQSENVIITFNKFSPGKMGDAYTELKKGTFIDNKYITRTFVFEGFQKVNNHLHAYSLSYNGHILAG